MYVVGLSGGFGHDAAACLVRDGRLIAMVEEERLVRLKRAPGVAPVHATLACLAEAGLTIDEVDRIALSWVPEHDPTTKSSKEAIQGLLQHDAFHGHTLPKIEIVDHHLAHAASAYYSSGFARAGILVVDGHGEGISVTSGYGDATTIALNHHSYGVEQSLGHFYNSVSRYLGLGDSSEGKLMGLAAYGQPVYDIPIIQLTDDGYRIAIPEQPDRPTHERYLNTRRFWDTWLCQHFGTRLIPDYHFDADNGRLRQNLPFTERHRNIAASAQQKLEQVIQLLAQQIVAQTGSRNLVLAGGVALNCAANGALLRSGIIDNIYLFPASHDAGGCLGAALEVCRWEGAVEPELIQTAAWGPAYSDAAIDRTLKHMRLDATYHDDIASVAAELLARNYVIGWFQGRLEVGPRALGQRSILANPRSTAMRDHVNQQVKYRELWRPFAPSVLAERAGAYMQKSTPSPFMLLAFQVAEEQREAIAAVLHVDGTTRPQTIDRDVNPLYWQLIRAFEQHTGLPMVLNTSFNLANEPIICSPTDAIRTFYACSLDALVLGHFLIVKPGACSLGAD